MPRKPRFFIAGIPNHIIQRGNNRDAVFFESADYKHYLELLADSAADHQVNIHAYVLMTNHVHILVMFPRFNGPLTSG